MHGKKYWGQESGWSLITAGFTLLQLPGGNVHHLCLPLSSTHWGWVAHICVSGLSIIGSDNGLSPGRHQAIIWTNAAILSIRSLGTNFNEILIEIYMCSFKKMHWKVSSGNKRPFCLCLNVLMYIHGAAICAFRWPLTDQSVTWRVTIVVSDTCRSARKPPRRWWHNMAGGERGFEFTPRLMLVEAFNPLWPRHRNKRHLVDSSFKWFFICMKVLKFLFKVLPSLFTRVQLMTSHH